MKDLFEINASALSQVKSKNSLHVIRTHDPKGPKGSCWRGSGGRDAKVRGGLLGFAVLSV